jgi:hypothetical protein
MADLCAQCGKFVPRACRDVVSAFACPFDLFAPPAEHDEVVDHGAEPSDRGGDRGAPEDGCAWGRRGRA